MKVIIRILLLLVLMFNANSLFAEVRKKHMTEGESPVWVYEKVTNPEVTLSFTIQTIDDRIVFIEAELEELEARRAEALALE